MKILITAPNLNSETNVSGISTVVNNIIEYNLLHNYFHFELGKSDKNRSFYYQSFQIVFKIIYFPIFIKKNKIELIHQNVPFNLKGITREFIFNRIGKLLQIKIIIHIHGGELLFKKSSNFIIKYFIAKILSGSEKIIVLSELEKKSLELNYNFSDLIILPNAIVIQNQNLFKTFSKLPTLIFFGRIHESKGVIEIIEMCKRLKEVVKFKFLMFGNGPQKEFVIKKLTDILGDDFNYGGIITSKNKMDAISKADYFLLPSRYGEGLPMALLESMSLGLIPIVTNDGSMELLIHDGVNGFKVNKYDANDLFSKILKVINDQNLRFEISKNAISTVTKSHNIIDYIKSLNIIYS